MVFHMFIRIALACALVCCVCMVCRAQLTEVNDSVEVDRSCQFKYRKLIAPASLVAAGAVAYPIHEKLGNWRHGRRVKVDDYIQYAPMAAYVFSGFADRTNKHNFWGRAEIAITASLIETCMVNALKYTVKEKRPDSRRRNAFPSGHTATAMLGAELCRLEYGWKVGAAAYAVAATTACLRVYNHRHWCNDVLAGAGIGIFSANAGYWLYPFEQRFFARLRHRRHQSDHSMLFIPTYEPSSQTAVIAFSLTY